MELSWMDIVWLVGPIVLVVGMGAALLHIQEELRRTKARLLVMELYQQDVDAQRAQANDDDRIWGMLMRGRKTAAIAWLLEERGMQLFEARMRVERLDRVMGLRVSR